MLIQQLEELTIVLNEVLVFMMILIQILIQNVLLVVKIVEK